MEMESLGLELDLTFFTMLTVVVQNRHSSVVCIKYQSHPAAQVQLMPRVSQVNSNALSSVMYRNLANIHCSNESANSKICYTKTCLFIVTMQYQ